MFWRWFFKINFLLVSFCLGLFFYLFQREWVDFSHLEHFDPGKPSVVLDAHGEEFIRFQLDKRDPITFDKLPDVLVQAFIAAEDWNFFKHSGISVKGIVRSFLINVYRRRVVQGASTITQQLAKLMFLSSERTIWRKVQEIFLAFQIERQFTKQQILELYLNNVYFGQGIYGVESAAVRFWNKSVFDITIDQAATMAAVAKSAKYYSPLNCPEKAKRRRNVVLSSMLKLGSIKKDQYQHSVKQELKIHDQFVGNNSVRLYLQEWIRTWVENKWGKDDLYKKGLKIKTTIDIEKQELAEKIFRKKIEQIRQDMDAKLNGGMMAIDSYSGKIKAVVGGYDFKESQYNRAFQATRQIGSTFKPILYSAALKKGLKFDDIWVDEPFEMQMPNGQIYKPKNWTHRFDGPMTLLRALTLSNNIIAIKVFLSVGPEFVIDLSKKFGINKALQTYPSAALGTAEGTVEDVAAFFNVFANYGTYVKPYLIEWVKNSWGEKLWENESVRWKVLDSKTNSKMVNALSYRIKRARLLLNEKEWIDAEAIGKTGGTNEATTMWFVGSTPELTSAVYIGRDDNKPLGRMAFANKTTFPIWLDFNRSLKFEKKHFYVDPELKEVAVDWITGYTTDRLNSLRTVNVLNEAEC